MRLEQRFDVLNEFKSLVKTKGWLECELSHVTAFAYDERLRLEAEIRKMDHQIASLFHDIVTDEVTPV